MMGVAERAQPGFSAAAAQGDRWVGGFPIDVLKIDKSFVDGVGGASDDSALARRDSAVA